MFKAVVTEKLNALNVAFSFLGNNEVHIISDIDSALKQNITNALKPYGITISANENLELVDRIKVAVDNLLESEDVLRYNTSEYLSEKLNYSYKYLSSLFTETTYTSIESYVILRKVDIAKDLLVHSKLTLTEVAHRLNYSSVAHLSRQFKKTTGLTPSVFQRIINQRNQLT